MSQIPQVLHPIKITQVPQVLQVSQTYKDFVYPIRILSEQIENVETLIKYTFDAEGLKYKIVESFTGPGYVFLDDCYTNGRKTVPILPEHNPNYTIYCIVYTMDKPKTEYTRCNADYSCGLHYLKEHSYAMKILEDCETSLDNLPYYVYGEDVEKCQDILEKIQQENMEKYKGIVSLDIMEEIYNNYFSQIPQIPQIPQSTQSTQSTQSPYNYYTVEYLPRRDDYLYYLSRPHPKTGGSDIPEPKKTN